MTIHALELVQITDPEVIRFTHLQNSNNWKGPLTVEQYADREAILGNSEVAKMNTTLAAKSQYPEGHEWLGLKYFVLKDKSLENKGKTSQIVASCETLNREGFCMRPGSSGCTEPALIVCIGGVYTFPEFRGRGYAKQMIEGINAKYDKLSQSTCKLLQNTVIILYSEVGDYYSRMGYKSLPVPLHHINDVDMLYEELQSLTPTSNKVKKKVLKYDNYQDLISIQTEEANVVLKNEYVTHPTSFIFSLKPDMAIYKWFQDRDIYISEQLERDHLPLSFGVSCTDNQSHIIWHHNWHSNSLIVLKLYVPEGVENAEDRVCELIGHAISEIHRQGMEKLEFWDSDIPVRSLPRLWQVLREMQAKPDAVELFTTNGSVSAVRPPPGYSTHDIIWANNSKFCWF